MTRASIEEKLSRLGRLVAARRKSLGLSIARAAQVAEISRTTWTAVEAGSRPTEGYIQGKIERTIRWEPGSFERVMGGGDPIPTADKESGSMTSIEITDPDLLRYAQILADPDVDPAQKQIMRTQMRLWGDQIEAQKRFADTGRRSA